MKITDSTLILGIETCTNICSVALWDGQQMHEQLIETARSHSKSLIPMIEQVLKQAGVSIREVEAIACARGPGSFTGVRIGIGVAKGIAFGQEIPIVPISPLQAIAYRTMQLAQAQQVAVLMDARMGELYAADYQNQQGLPLLQGKERLTDITAIHAQGQVFAGTGMLEYAEELAAKQAVLSAVVFPHAADVVMLAKQLDNVDMVSAAEFVPTYLRDKVTD